jgi:hypothetical protein
MGPFKSAGSVFLQWTARRKEAAEGGGGSAAMAAVASAFGGTGRGGGVCYDEVKKTFRSSPVIFIFSLLLNLLCVPIKMTAPLLPVAAVIHVAGAGDYVLDLVATRDGSFLAAGTSGGAVVGLDPAAAGGAATLLVGRHAAAVTACVLDQASIITSSLDGTVGVWDTRAGGGAGPAQR